MVAWKEHWPGFCAKMEQRLEAGHLEYGDGSFRRPIKDLAQEIEEEALDIVGWGFIMYCRLQNLKKLLNQFLTENRIHETPIGDVAARRPFDRVPSPVEEVRGASPVPMQEFSPKTWDCSNCGWAPRAGRVVEVHIYRGHYMRACPECGTRDAVAYCV